ncbi:hypothetical protein LTR94_025780 [Friedmanniomyces endolithicus]|nr:hypothetical protein LTR94_025780 [Friedmanniomyces endolithicus]
MAQTCAFKGQPLGRPILGSTASLAPADRASVEAWRARLYSPDRMVVSASGAVDETQLLNLAERWFGQAAPLEVEPPAACVFVGGHAKLSRKIEQANLVFQLPGLAATDPGLPAMRLFAEILGGGMASRLFQSAREERGLAYAIDAYHEPYEDGGILGIYAGAAADRAKELAQVSAQELDALASQGPGEAELSRAKAVMRAGLWMSDENPMSRAGRNAAQTLIFGAPIASDALTQALEAQGVAEVRAVGERLLASSRSASAVLGPKAAAGSGEAFSKAFRAVGLELSALAPADLEIEVVEIGDLNLYNPDLDTDAPPQAWVRFRQEIAAFDAVLFVTPEYNRSVPGALKNALDVGSRPYGKSVWQGKPCAIVSVSPGALGGFGANHHLRQPLVFLNMPVMQQPEAYIGHVADLVNEETGQVQETSKAFLQAFVDAFAAWVKTTSV